MWRNLLAVMLLGAAGSAWAASSGVMVENAWLRETVPGQTTVSVQLDLTSTKMSGKLIKVESPVSESGELQKLWPSHGKIKKVPVKNMRLPHGRAVAFGERTVSIMLIGLKKAVKEGEQVPINLTVMLADGNKVVVEAKAEVRAQELSYKHYQKEDIQDH